MRKHYSVLHPNFFSHNIKHFPVLFTDNPGDLKATKILAIETT